VMWVAGAAAAHAQIAPVGVPKGLVRIELGGLFGGFGDAYVDGHRESYASDLSSPALGSDRLPALTAVDTRIGEIIGNTGFHLNLGRLSADAQTDISTAVLGLGIGLSNRLTVFGRLPLVRSRTQSAIRLDPTNADAGFALSADQQATFFQQFETALGTLDAKLTAGDYDSDPAKKTLAQATRTNGTALHDNLFALLGDPVPSAPFAPTEASAAGAAILAQIAALQTTLGNLNVSGFASAPLLPSQQLTADEFATFLSANDGLGFRTDDAEVQYRGDAELGAALTLIDTWNRAGRLGGVRAALSTLVRLPTGLRERPDRLLDIGTGDGQTDVEIELVTDVGDRSWGTRLTGTYVRQLPADITQRVTSPTQPLAGLERLAVVRWDPGDVVAIGAWPFYRLAPSFAIQAGVDHWRRGADQVSYAVSSSAIPGVDAGILATDSRASATTFGAGLTYANAGRFTPGGRGWPVEASCVFERVIRGGAGRVPAVQQVRANLRLYFSLFR
jgi:hypothetical protein